MHIKKFIALMLACVALTTLAGCHIKAAEELYSPPKRSEAYRGLQLKIDEVMDGLDYSAPIAGENQQTVQLADLDGDGANEYILFARGATEQPMQIFIFDQINGEYRLLDSVCASGAAFEQVEYVQMDDNPGLEMVVGYQLSGEVLRVVSVYSLQGSQMEQLVRTSYAKFVCCDLDVDKKSELLVLRPDEDNTVNGIAELFSIESGSAERSAEVGLSEPAEHIKRIMVSRLDGGLPAVYVASEVDSGAIITDVFSVVDGQFTNVSFSHEAGTSVQTFRNYYVYADDIDDDGVLELPNLIVSQNSDTHPHDQYVIRWYSMTPDGAEVDKLYTYHNYVGGWYISLAADIAPKLSVTQMGNSFDFYIHDEGAEEPERLMSIYALTGQKREEQALVNNRFVLFRTESTVYAAHLDVASGAYGMSKDGLIDSFHLIVQDWKTGET